MSLTAVVQKIESEIQNYTTALTNITPQAQRLQGGLAALQSIYEPIKAMLDAAMPGTAIDNVVDGVQTAINTIDSLMPGPSSSNTTPASQNATSSVNNNGN